MKTLNFLILATLIALGTACGGSYYEDYYEDEAYFDEAMFEEMSPEERIAYAEMMAMEDGPEAPNFRTVANTNGSATGNAQMSNGNWSNEQMSNDNWSNGQTATSQMSNNNWTNESMSNGNMRMLHVKDPKTGMTGASFPMPSYWRIDGTKFKGPGNAVIEHRQGGFVPGTQRQLTSINQVIEQEVMPALRQGGVQVLKTYDLPEIARKDGQEFAKYWEVTRTRKQHEAKGLEITSELGKALIVVHFTATYSQFGNFAYYNYHVLDAPKSKFEQLKKDFLYTLKNYQTNPQIIAMHNQREQQKSQASWAAHNQKMRSRQQNFDSWQQSRQTMSDVSDIYMDMYKNKNAASDRMQERTIDGIWEQQSMTNPYSGQRTKVQSGYNNYWVDQNGNRIQNNNALYNPNLDPNRNSTNWRRMQGGGY